MPLESISRCLQGTIPSRIATCSEDGVPNITTLSIVHYVDAERVALSHQYFNKTRANLGAVASQTGIGEVFRLRGVDIHHVMSCAAVGEESQALRRGPAPDPLPLLDELLRRLAICVTYDDATRAGLEALEDLFGFEQSILLVADESGDHLFAVAGHGYPSSAAGAEVPVGTGLVGVAAARRRVVYMSNLALSRGMRAAIGEALANRGGAAPGRRSPFPGSIPRSVPPRFC